jgi:hypothetical protein
MNVQRTSIYDRHRALILSSFLAAHVVYGDDGFRLKEVQFFFYLFSNWMENDKNSKTIDIQLVQIKRLIVGFIKSRFLEEIRSARQKKYLFNLLGCTHIIKELVNGNRFLSLSEIILIQYILIEYQQLILKSFHARSVFIGPSEISALQNLVDPSQFITGQIVASSLIIKDLRIRLEDNAAMDQYITRAREDEWAISKILGGLSKKFSYQLTARKVLSDVFMEFSPEMLEAELKHGFRNRQRFLFKNLLTEYIERVRFLQEMLNDSAI